ncbi:MAG: Mur ligase domain-containing protein, partial [Alphaproteobacteria bacterium]
MRGAVPAWRVSRLRRDARGRFRRRLMHVHILGVCGTFMGGIAAIAKAAGHRVTGPDRNVYPPMS